MIKSLHNKINFAYEKMHMKKKKKKKKKKNRQISFAVNIQFKLDLHG